MSNSRLIIDSLPERERIKAVQNLDLTQSVLPVERALVVEWDTETDELKICRAQVYQTRFAEYRQLCLRPY